MFIYFFDKLSQSSSNVNVISFFAIYFLYLIYDVFYLINKE